MSYCMVLDTWAHTRVTGPGPIGRPHKGTIGIFSDVSTLFDMEITKFAQSNMKIISLL